MRPRWVERYLQIPFCEKGRSRAGVDCYGLLRLIYQEQRGIELPSYVEGYATTADAKEITALVRHEVASNWSEIPLPEARLFDVVIFRLLGQPMHIGTVLDPPWFLHAVKRQGQTTGKTWIERWDSLLWEKRLLAAVRWEGA